MSVSARLRTALRAAAFVMLLAAPARAEVLVLPVPPDTVLAPLAAACPGCAGAGFLPCGSPDVQYGRGFAAAAMQGAPPRGYLLARAPTSLELVPLLAGEDAATVVDALHRQFAGLRLMVIDDGWRSARVLAPDKPPEIVLDPQQQACFRDPERGLGCCLGDGPRARGCLPKADPPSVRLGFLDPASGERLALRYPVGKGEATLRRQGADGAAALYWCHKSARAGLVAPR